MQRAGSRLLFQAIAVALVAAAAAPAARADQKHKRATPTEPTDHLLSPADAALLQRNNPVLVIFPQDTARKRPGAGVLGRPGSKGFGDYHPISVEAFLDRGHLRPRQGGREAWKAVLKTVTGVGWKPLTPTGEARAEKMILSRPTDDHEIDLAAIRAQGQEKAWKTLGADLAAPKGAPLDKPVVYGRVATDGQGGKILQYYYLYLYNDFINNHEADWEMAAVRLDAEGNPAQMGLSSHHGGQSLDWHDVQTTEGGRPVAYVARGSHALYFAYTRDGHPLIDLDNLGIKGNIRKWVVKFSPGKRSRDKVPVDPASAAAPSAEWHQVGERLETEVRQLPTWARTYRGTWGGAAKIKPHFDGVGIKGPWATIDARWQDPVKWMKELRPANELPVKPAGRIARMVAGFRAKASAARRIPGAIRARVRGRSAAGKIKSTHR